MNPFTQRSRIKDPADFYGRVAELHDLYTLIASMQSCSVVGPRRVGKSSLLYFLTLPEAYSRHLADGESYVFGYIDLQELIGLQVDDFFFTALDRFSHANPQLQIDLDKDGSSSGFRRFLARASGEGYRFVLCCDAFEMLSQNASFGVDFFTYLRGLCSNYNLSLVTSSRDSLYELCHQGNLQTSQFWNIFVERSLGLMPDEEAYELIHRPFEKTDMVLDNGVADFVYELAGPHPFFLQIACFHLYEALRQGADDESLEGVIRAFKEEARPHYTYGWERLDNEARVVLRALATEGKRPIDLTLFHQLKRAALVVGEPEAARLSSGGWEGFIAEGTLPGQASTPETMRMDVNRGFQVKPLQVSDVPTLLEEVVKVGRYQILEELGHGGMARVYRAYDPNFRRDVAVKLLPMIFVDDPAYRTRFEREAQSIAALEHPAIVPVYDFGQDRGQPFLVMRLMPGGTLADRLKDGPLDLEAAVQLVSRIATALEEAHTIGIVHRDIKPANILFDQYGNPYLSDFGIAQISEHVGAMTQSAIIGTPAYMSPEQIYGDMKVDGRSDLYSLGVMFFEAVTGENPFPADTPSKVMMRHLTDPVPQARESRVDLPAELESVIQKVLAKKPEQRFATVGEFARALVAVVRSASG